MILGSLACVRIVLSQVADEVTDAGVAVVERHVLTALCPAASVMLGWASPKTDRLLIR